VRGTGEIVTAFVPAPVQEHVDHAHAPPEERTDLAVHDRYAVLRSQCRADADMRRFLSQARCISAELARALQVDRLGVEDAGTKHRPEHLEHLAVVLREGRKLAANMAGRIEDLSILDLKLGHCFHY